MRVFVQNDRGIEVTVAVRFGINEDIHLHASRFAVGWRGEVGIINAAPVLGIGLHRVPADATSAKIIILKVAGGLGEAQIVQSVMIPVAPIKELHHRRLAVAAGRQG